MNYHIRNILARLTSFIVVFLLFTQSVSTLASTVVFIASADFCNSAYNTNTDYAILSADSGEISANSFNGFWEAEELEVSEPSPSKGCEDQPKALRAKYDISKDVIQPIGPDYFQNITAQARYSQDQCQLYLTIHNIKVHC